MLFHIYTDGACNPNPGPGGWSAIVTEGENQVAALSGKKSATTNNEMELTGLLRALEWLHENGVEKAAIISDSQYALGCVKWAFGWERKGWTKKGGPIKNLAVIQQIHDLNQRMEIEWQWVRGHNGDRWNEAADQLAESCC